MNMRVNQSSALSPSFMGMDYGNMANQAMGINPVAANPFMFSNGMDPTSGVAPGNWSSTLAPGGVPSIPQIGATGPDYGDAGGSIWDSFLTKDGNQGWGNTAMGAAGGLFNAWMGMKQYGLAKDTLETNKQQFAQNFAAQQKMTNSRLEDRQRARVASNAGAYQSVGDYMKQNGV